ncbi:hypothetical protein LOZ65_005750 [Ophidiomyces ophidiicola]|nr:hypothetical protein LOZ65_005750 [Ophidiomyces ophidiicola]
MTTILISARTSSTNSVPYESQTKRPLNDSSLPDWRRIPNYPIHKQLNTQSVPIVMPQSRVPEKDIAAPGRTRNGTKISGKENTATNDWHEAMGKRKAVDYEEDIEGFQFSRTSRPKKPRSISTTSAECRAVDRLPAHEKPGQPHRTEFTDSMRSSSEGLDVRKRRPGKTKDPDTEDNCPPEAATPAFPLDGTKIILPFADTPVMQRNKEMRQERGRGQRRSSFGMRGRRASSLIESGTSNALPHDKVDTADFYKHIESEALSEPRRMRQLLTWCATRAMGEKPSGSRSHDESVKLAARVIQEEMLKEFSNRSALADWFSREETTALAVVVKKPNPKNEQNVEKIKELEEHIQRLQAERQSLAALLRLPLVPRIKSTFADAEKSGPGDSGTNSTNTSAINSTFLDDTQRSLLTVLAEPLLTPHPVLTSSTESSDSTLSLTTRLTSLSSSLAPILDSFATGVHNIELYRSMADMMAGGVLRICAQSLEQRDFGLLAARKVGDSQVPDDTGGNTVENSQKEDLKRVLGALGRLENK